MSKIVWIVGIILMIMVATTVVSASESKGDVQVKTFAVNAEGAGQQPVVADANGANKGTANTVKSFTGKSFQSTSGDAAPSVYWLVPQFAWGRYGPINQACCTSMFYRIFYGGSFIDRYPTVTDTLNVRYPLDSMAVYSLGVDAGYTFLDSFDARLRTWQGYLTNAYIDWQAIA